LNARIWFLLASLALITVWHELRVSNFRQEQGALLRRLELGPDYAAGDYLLLRREIERLRAQPVPDYRLETLQQEVEADAARSADSLVKMRLPYSPKVTADLIALASKVKRGQYVKTRASTLAREFRADSLKAESLVGVMRWGHEQQRRNLLLTAGASVLALILILAYRASWLPARRFREESNAAR
jgi:hypothetical protein